MKSASLFFSFFIFSSALAQNRTTEEFQSFLSEGGQVDCGVPSEKKKKTISLDSPSSSSHSYRIEFEIPPNRSNHSAFPRITTATHHQIYKDEEGLSSKKTSRLFFRPLKTTLSKKNQEHFSSIRNDIHASYGLYQDLPLIREGKKRKAFYMAPLEPQTAQLEERESGSLKTLSFKELDEKEKELFKFTSRMIFAAVLHCKDQHRLNKRKEKKNSAPWKDPQGAAR